MIDVQKVINLTELSKLTGFSTATISRALNGLYHGNMKKETYDKIIKVADSCGYIPNKLSAGLRSGFTNIVGIVFPSNINPYYALLGNLIEKKAFLNGYLTYVCNSDYDAEKSLVYIKMLKSHMASGILLCNTGLSKSIIEKFNSNSSPIILLDEEVSDYNGASVIIDDFRGGYIGTEFLIKSNHHKIAFIAGPKKINSSKKRLEGSKAALKAYNVKIKENIFFYGDYSIESGKTIVNEILSEHKDISAIFCFNDLMAIGACISLKKLNLKIPNQISVLGYDNNIFSSIVYPSISTIATPVITIADYALKIILNYRKDKKILNKKFVVTPYLIERESTIRK